MAFMEVCFDKATEIPSSLTWKIGTAPKAVSLKEEGYVCSEDNDNHLFIYFSFISLSS